MLRYTLDKCGVEGPGGRSRVKKGQIVSNRGLVKKGRKMSDRGWVKKGQIVSDRG
jgi:hypothetical protein